MCVFQVLILENDDPTWLSYDGWLNHQANWISFHSWVWTDGPFSIEMFRVTLHHVICENWRLQIAQLSIPKKVGCLARIDQKTLLEITNPRIGWRKMRQGHRIFGMFSAFQMDRLIQCFPSQRCLCCTNTQQLKCSVSEFATRVATKPSP